MSEVENQQVSTVSLQFHETVIWIQDDRVNDVLNVNQGGDADPWFRKETQGVTDERAGTSGRGRHSFSVRRKIDRLEMDWRHPGKSDDSIRPHGRGGRG